MLTGKLRSIIALISFSDNNSVASESEDLIQLVPCQTETKGSLPAKDCSLEENLRIRCV